MNREDNTAPADRPMDRENRWLKSHVYQTLRAIAHSRMQNERANHILQTTALVNEAYLILCKHTLDGSPPSEADMRSFYFEAARAMRNILIGEARKRDAAKRGGGSLRQVTLDTNRLIVGSETEIDYLELHEALDRLEKLESRAGQVVALRFFTGMDMPHIAAVLGVSLRTVEKDWAFARAWLRNELGDQRES